MIVLDDGRVTEGIECWWIPVELAEKLEKEVEKDEL